MSLHRIHSYVNTLKFDWHIISLLISIEKFDAEWLSTKQNEAAVFRNCKDVISYDLFFEQAQEFIDIANTDIINGFDTVKFWYDTALEMQPLIRCLLFGYFVQQIVITYDNYRNLGTQAAMVLLYEAGYNWVKYISSPPVYCLDITDWLSSFLSILRDEQLLLLRKLDLYGVRSLLSLKEKLLLHIIENNTGIKTTAIARKLGLSRATVKRMLKILQGKKLIMLIGINRAVCYKLL